MSLAIVYTRAALGIEAPLITVEVHLSNGLPGLTMVDRYWYGPTSRISPEAPVPVVKVENIEERPGGAANVAMNIASGAITSQGHCVIWWWMNCIRLMVRRGRIWPVWCAA